MTVAVGGWAAEAGATFGTIAGGPAPRPSRRWPAAGTLPRLLGDRRTARPRRLPGAVRRRLRRRRAGGLRDGRDQPADPGPGRAGDRGRPAGGGGLVSRRRVGRGRAASCSAAGGCPSSASCEQVGGPPRIEDVDAAARATLARRLEGVDGRRRADRRRRRQPRHRVASPCSRGRSSTSCARAGFAPFVVPAMGSHGGGTAEGQLEVLADFGVTEDAMGVPIRATMETVTIGERRRLPGRDRPQRRRGRPGVPRQPGQAAHRLPRRRSPAGSPRWRRSGSPSSDGAQRVHRLGSDGLRDLSRRSAATSASGCCSAASRSSRTASTRRCSWRRSAPRTSAARARRRCSRRRPRSSRASRSPISTCSSWSGSARTSAARRSTRTSSAAGW